MFVVLTQKILNLNEVEIATIILVLNKIIHRRIATIVNEGMKHSIRCPRINGPLSISSISQSKLILLESFFLKDLSGKAPRHGMFFILSKKPRHLSTHALNEQSKTSKIVKQHLFGFFYCSFQFSDESFFRCHLLPVDRLCEFVPNAVI